MLNRAAAAVLVAVLVSGLMFFSGCRGRGHHEKAAYFMVDYIAETLDLADSQREQLNGIKDELVEKGKSLREKHRALHEEMMAQLKSDAIDQQRLKDVVADSRARMDEMISLAIARLAEFHQTLTPEQKIKLVDKLENFKKFHRPRWE